MPFGNNLGTLVQGKPDLYGPMWILITLVFCLTVLANFSKYIYVVVVQGVRAVMTTGG